MFQKVATVDQEAFSQQSDNIKALPAK